MRKKVFGLAVLLLVATSFVTSCGTRQSATSNSKMSKVSSTEQNSTAAKGESVLATEQSTQAKSVNAHAIVKENSTYDCDIAADKAAYDGHVDITVGDNLFATQINDWYMYFDQYEGKVVEIEGYYIGDFQPYDFVGRYGPSCPYCQGGYVSFEILSDEDLTQYQSVKDWIKVTGILRQGVDSMKGPFYYIEALQIEKMPTVGVDTVTN
jgi:uncharacterized membrane protein YcgQ (UPF0703/DUF1980 family)